MFIKVTLGTTAANRALAEGRIGKILEQTMARIKPEASYFTSINGRRSMLFFADIPTTADIPMFLEPFWSELEAEIEVTPVMNAPELQAGLAKLPKR